MRRVIYYAVLMLFAGVLVYPLLRYLVDALQTTVEVLGCV